MVRKTSVKKQKGNLYKVTFHKRNRNKAKIVKGRINANILAKMYRKKKFDI